MTQPSKTLYISNLNDKTKKPELRHQLYQLFTPFGRVIDVVAVKVGPAVCPLADERKDFRGQAFIVFSDQVAATTALRTLGGETFYGKPLKIAYSRTVSKALLPASQSTAPPQAKVVTSNAQRDADDLKRTREEEDTIHEREGKKAKGDDEDDDDMDMDADSDDAPGPKP